MCADRICWRSGAGCRPQDEEGGDTNSDNNGDDDHQYPAAALGFLRGLRRHTSLDAFLRHSRRESAFRFLRPQTHFPHQTLDTAFILKGYENRGTRRCRLALYLNQAGELSRLNQILCP